MTRSSVTFTSQAAIDSDVRGGLALEKSLVAVRDTRNISKSSMIHNTLQPNIEVDPQNYHVYADGKLLTCEPATVLPMAQRYFLF
jgi:urease subunit alpha